MGIISIFMNNDDFKRHNNNNIGGGGSIISWNPYDIATRQYLLEQLPKKVQSQMTSNIHDDYKLLPEILANIVAGPARNQSIKGIFTLGFRKSIRYATAKLSKGLFRSSVK